MIDWVVTGWTFGVIIGALLLVVIAFLIGGETVGAFAVYGWFFLIVIVIPLYLDYHGYHMFGADYNTCTARC